MFYKVTKNGHTVDALDHLDFVCYEPRHKIMINCIEDDAQGIISSDGNYIWHVEGYPDIPVGVYDTVILTEIDQYEYNRYRTLGMKTPEEIIDAYTLTLIQGGIL